MRIADALGIPNVRIELLENAILSKVEWDVELKSFIELSEEFSHSFHLSNLSTFNISTLLNETTNIYWREVATMLLFDAVIGNSDRHPGNFLYNERKGFYPLFDNGSSLCCYIEEDKLESYIKDELRFKSLCLSKSKPVLRDDSKITHYDLVKILNRRYPILVSGFAKQLSKLDIESILTDLEISSNRKQLLIKFINERKRWFNE